MKRKKQLRRSNYTVDGNAPKQDKTLIVSLSKIKIPHPFQKKLKKKENERIEKPRDAFPNTNEKIIKNSKVSEGWVESEEPPNVVDGDDLKSSKTPIFPLYQIKIPPQFPQRIKKKEDNTKFKKFFSKFSNLMVNIQLIESLQKIPGYARFMKELVTKKFHEIFKL